MMGRWRLRKLEFGDPGNDNGYEVLEKEVTVWQNFSCSQSQNSH